MQASAQPTQIIQIPATPGPSVPANIQIPQGNVKYIKLPPGVTKGTYNLRSTPLNNTIATKASTINTATPGKTNLQNIQVKQNPITPGMPNTPKVNTSTTTMVRKGKGRGKQTSTISVLDTIQDEYSVEVEGEEFDDSDSDATELYEILANIIKPEEEVNLELEPELDPPI